MRFTNFFNNNNKKSMKKLILIPILAFAVAYTFTQVSTRSSFHHGGSGSSISSSSSPHLREHRRLLEKKKKKNTDSSSSSSSSKNTPRTTHIITTRKKPSKAKAKNIPTPTTRRRRKLSKAKSHCTLQVVASLQLPDSSPLEEDDEEIECEMNPTDIENGYSGISLTFDMTNEQKTTLKQMWKRGEFISNESTLDITGLKFDNKKIVVPKKFKVTDKISKKWNNIKNKKNEEERGKEVKQASPSKRRDLQQEVVDYGPQTNDKNVLVVRITDINGLARPEDAYQISDDVFGTYGDAVTMKSQLESCSMGRLTINAGGIPSHEEYYAAPGVIDITIDIDITNSTYNRNDIRNAAIISVQDYFNDNLGTNNFTLPGEYHLVMFVLQKCYGTGCNWAAFASVNSWSSMYQDRYYKHVGVQVHEIG